jgi:putative DNA primase/helicase
MRAADPSANGAAPPPKALTPDDVATIADLERAGAEISWFWDGWIQRGVLSILAAEGGCGKTRFAADLVRRIRHGLAWPDGTPVGLPRDTPVLWVVADNHHDEMVSLSRAFEIADVVRINASPAEPYGGTTLDTLEELATLEARVAAVGAGFMVVDTVGNSTDRKLSLQEDAKAYYQPLQLIARRQKVAGLCLTHLNASGMVLGRRAKEKARTVLMMDRPDPLGQPNRRKLWVDKTNSKTPSPLGITMGDHGNEYDDQPPVKPEDAAVGSRVRNQPSGLDRACEWLRDYLAVGPARVSRVRTEAETAGFGPKVLYAAKDSLGVHEYSEEGRKWWELTANHDT